MVILHYFQSLQEREACEESYRATTQDCIVATGVRLH